MSHMCATSSSYGYTYMREGLQLAEATFTSLHSNNSYICVYTAHEKKVNIQHFVLNCFFPSSFFY